MRQAALILLIAVGVIGIRGCARGRGSADAQRETARPFGVEEARRDIAAGRLALKTHGLLSAQGGAFADLLRTRLGVELTEVAGCAVPGEQLREIMAYNRVMTAEIERRFGSGIVERLRQEAAVRTAATRPAA